ncbi:MAG: AgmX/PglI C-terminal domain-containing protein, partial [Bdellovibrionales bacterium]
VLGTRTEIWKSEIIEGFKIFQKTIKTEDISSLGHITPKDLVDEESKKPLVVALSLALLLSLFSLFIPKYEQKISTWQPKEAQRIVVDMESLKKRKVAKSQAVEIEKQDVKKAAGGSGKVSGLLKNLNVGRISNLVGKVSASEAASKNIIVQNGIKAGQGVSGRALAALGKENKDGKDWNKEGNGQGVSVSTAGKAGGNSLAGLGGLKAGRTGEGGVGLIEDEGEVSGGLDRDIIAEYIKRQIGHILACYERQLSAKKDLGGKVSVKFTIGGTGSVETQNITESTMKDATVEGCILNRVAKWNFPAPNGGTKVIVTYPFLFKSTN